MPSAYYVRYWKVNGPSVSFLGSLSRQVHQISYSSEIASLSEAQRAEGLTGILDIMALDSLILGIFVLVGAVSSQLSAAIADSIGSGGLMLQVSRRKLSIRNAFIAASALSIAVVLLTDPFSVIALSWRALALFYAIQAMLALWVSIRTGEGGRVGKAGFVVVGLICIVAALAGAPAGG